MSKVDWKKIKRNSVKICSKCKSRKSYTNPLEKCDKCKKKFCFDCLLGSLGRSGVVNTCDLCQK